MSKVLQYKEEPFTGSVTFSDPLSLEQEAAIERANAAMRRTLEALGGTSNGPSALIAAILPGILACVEKHTLTGIPDNPTIQTWPTRPRVAVSLLVAWLLREVGKLYQDTVDPEAPNALPPQPTPTPAAKDPSLENSTSSTVSTVSVSKPS